MKIEVQNYKDTRSGFGDGLVEAGKRNPKVVALTADLTGSVKMGDFKKEFPDRFFQVGIAEANMIGIAAGLSIGGYIPFTGTFANFSSARVYDQIRMVVAYSNKNVNVCASHAGVTLGEDGATHQTLEDVGMMKMLPNMTVLVPCDYNQTKAATIAAAEHDGPVYLRFGRPKVANFTPVDEPFMPYNSRCRASRPGSPSPWRSARSRRESWSRSHDGDSARPPRDRSDRLPP